MPAQQGSLVSSLLMFGLMFVVFYFLLIRPQQVQQRKRREMLSSLRKGNHVVTVGGIYAQIVDVKEDSLTLEIADKVRVKTTRAAVGAVLGKGEAAKDKEPEIAG